jgi:hypothetical protein
MFFSPPNQVYKALTIPQDHQPTEVAAQSSSTEPANGQGPPKEDGEGLAGEEKPGENKEGDENVEDNSGDQPNQVTAEAGVNGVTGFPNANMNFGAGNFDQMQMMMAMQNGMGPNAFGGFPLMGSYCPNKTSASLGLRDNRTGQALILRNTGMPGMPMDPMAMQNMYMSGGFGTQGMGMNGMNMGMRGMNNWNNGQSWNVGPDNMNYPNASGMGTGDLGSFNSGFQTGYNQGNYGSGFNNYRQSQYGFRGRGRGRGAYGQFGYNNRGGYNQGTGYGHSGYQEQPNYMAQQQTQQPGVNGQSLDNGTGPTDDEVQNGEAKPNGVTVDEFGRELRVQETTEGADGQATAEADTAQSEQQQEGTNGHGPPQDPSYDASQENGPGHGMNGPHTGNVGPYDGPFSGMNGHIGVPGFTGPPINRAPSQGYGSRSGSLQPVPTPAPDVPLNAPKGPKALLRGLPNTSILHLKARGLAVDDRPNGQNYGGTDESNGAQSGNNSPADYSRNSHHHDHDHSKDRSGRDYNDRDHDRYDRDRSRSPDARSRTRSRSRDRKDKDSHRSSRRRRHRSESVVSDRDGERDDDSRSKRYRSSRKHRDDVDDVEAKTTTSRDEEPAGEEEEEDDKRSSHPRSSRRDRDGEKRSSRDKERDSHRDRDRDRDRDRGHDRDRDRDRHRDSKSHRSSHRDRDYDRHSSHRDRDREREKNKDRDRKDKDRHRRSDRDREHRHRSSKRPSAEPEESATAKDDFNPPAGPSGSSSHGLEIKGASSRFRQDAGTERRRSSITTGPGSVDPHAAERAARDRERLLEQTRRLASLGVKRGRGDDAADDSSRRSSRRKGRRGEVVGVDDEEERMRRLEAEREAARFRDD